MFLEQTEYLHVHLHGLLTSEVGKPDIVVGCEKLLQLRFNSVGSLAAVELDGDDKS